MHCREIVSKVVVSLCVATNNAPVVPALSRRSGTNTLAPTYVTRAYVPQVRSRALERSVELLFCASFLGFATPDQQTWTTLTCPTLISMPFCEVHSSPWLVVKSTHRVRKYVDIEADMCLK
jgi:hypothetical protein